MDLLWTALSFLPLPEKALSWSTGTWNHRIESQNYRVSWAGRESKTVFYFLEFSMWMPTVEADLSSLLCFVVFFAKFCMFHVIRPCNCNFFHYAELGPQLSKQKISHVKIQPNGNLFCMFNACPTLKDVCECRRTCRWCSLLVLPIPVQQLISIMSLSA